jgi:hypothetical protein
MKREMALAALLPCLAVIPTVSGQTSPIVRPTTPVRSDEANPPPPIPQEKVDQAMQKIRDKEQARKESGATTRPADDVTPTDPNAMRAEIMRLRRHISALREENKELRSQMIGLARDSTQARTAVEQAQAAAERAERSAANAAGDNTVYPDSYYDRDYVNPGHIIYGDQIPVIPNANPGQPTQQKITPPGNAMNGAKAYPNYNGPANVPQDNTKPAPTGGPNGKGGDTNVRPSGPNPTGTINENAKNPGNANSAGNRTGGGAGQSTGTPSGQK